jgi:hypothetical protein
MITTLADIQHYFRQLATTSPDIKHFIVGDAEQILSEDRGRINYPVLWLETPRLSWSIKNGQRAYDLYFVVLFNAKPENWTHQQYILHRSLEITSRIITKMRSDAEDDIIIIGDASSDPILGYGHDHDYGWRTRISIQAAIGPCKPCHFLAACPVGAMAAFSWENKADGGFSNLAVTDTSNYADTTGWTITWYWKIDTGTTQSSSSLPGPDFGSGSFMLLWVVIERGECTLTASAYITAIASCGNSVPQLLSLKYC